MKMFNKDGVECNCTPEQQSVMEAGGWSRTNPLLEKKVEVNDLADESDDTDASDDTTADSVEDTSTKKPSPKRRKAIKK